MSRKRNSAKRNTPYSDILLGQHLYRVVSNHTTDSKSKTESLELKLDKVKVVGISCQADPEAKGGVTITYNVEVPDCDGGLQTFPDSIIGKSVFVQLVDAIMCASKAIDNSCFGQEVE